MISLIDFDVEKSIVWQEIQANIYSKACIKSLCGRSGSGLGVRYFQKKPKPIAVKQSQGDLESTRL